MNYEIVDLEERLIIGMESRTNNKAPDMPMKVNRMWKSFIQNKIHEELYDKKNNKVLGIYTNYAGDETDDYTFGVACEVTTAKQMPIGMVERTIPAGKYAKFSILINEQKDIASFWFILWQMDLPRSFVFDFEEYQDTNMKNTRVYIYIGLK